MWFVPAELGPETGLAFTFVYIYIWILLSLKLISETGKAPSKCNERTLKSRFFFRHLADRRPENTVLGTLSWCGLSNCLTQTDSSQLKVFKELDQAYSSKVIHSSERIKVPFIIMLLCTEDLKSYQVNKINSIRSMAQGEALVFTPKISIFFLSPPLSEHVSDLCFGFGFRSSQSFFSFFFF